MTDYVIAAGRSSFYPKRHNGSQFVGTRATFCETADLKSPDANVQAIPSTPVKVVKASSVSAPESFFGFHVLDRANDNSTAALAKTVRSHDMKDGKSRWKFIETSDNVWDFSVIDTWVNAHVAAGRDLVFTLFGTPAWASARPSEQGVYGASNLGLQAEPSDMTKWDRYCTKVAQRYLGRIKYYEVWNEPNIGNDGVGDGVDGTGLTASGKSAKNFFFSGKFAKLAEMVRRANAAIKAVDPTAKIISPSITNWSATASQSAETYFTSMLATSTGDGGNTPMKDWVDIISVHLYQQTLNDTSTLSGMIDRINAGKATAGVTAKETWDTESTPIVPNMSSLDDTQAKRYLGRFLLLAAAKGISRTMFYQLDNSTGFLSRPSVVAYWNSMRRLLLSGTVQSVSQLSDGRVVYYTSTGAITV